MEKLQAALARAREKREGTPSPRPQTAMRTSPRREAQAAAVDGRWDALERLEPSGKRMRQSRIYAADVNTDSGHFDILRTKLILEMRRHNWTRIAITSAAPSSGKTTTACNLIASLGRQPELRAGLFDVDLRRPSVHKFFGTTTGTSFAEVLSGDVPFEQQARKLDDNTFICLTEGPVHDPARLLLQSRTEELLDDIQAKYQPDLMLFDLPPVLVSDEARGFLKLVDAALIVVAAESTTVDQIDHCEREVAGYTSVAGVVLNKCRFVEDGYNYNY